MNSSVEGWKSDPAELKSFPLLSNSSAAALKALRLPTNVFFDPVNSSLDGEKRLLAFFLLRTFTLAVASSELKAKIKTTAKQARSLGLFIDSIIAVWLNISKRKDLIKKGIKPIFCLFFNDFQDFDKKSENYAWQLSSNVLQL